MTCCHDGPSETGFILACNTLETAGRTDHVLRGRHALCYRSSKGASSVSARGPRRRESRSPFGPGPPFCRSLRSSSLSKICSCASPADVPASLRAPFSATANSLRATPLRPHGSKPRHSCNLHAAAAAGGPVRHRRRRPLEPARFFGHACPKGRRQLRGGSLLLGLKSRAATEPTLLAGWQTQLKPGRRMKGARGRAALTRSPRCASCQASPARAAARGGAGGRDRMRRGRAAMSWRWQRGACARLHLPSRPLTRRAACSGAQGEPCRGVPFCMLGAILARHETIACGRVQAARLRLARTQTGCGQHRGAAAWLPQPWPLGAARGRQPGGWLLWGQGGCVVGQLLSIIGQRRPLPIIITPLEDAPACMSKGFAATVGGWCWAVHAAMRTEPV
jgi:hypothetical protein